MTYDPRRDDLLFQSAQSDGKGGFVQPSASPDPRDALIAELCEALKLAEPCLGVDAEGMPMARWLSLDELKRRKKIVSAALRRARGLA